MLTLRVCACLRACVLASLRFFFLLACVSLHVNANISASGSLVGVNFRACAYDCALVHMHNISSCWYVCFMGHFLYIVSMQALKIPIDKFAAFHTSGLKYKH